MSSEYVVTQDHLDAGTISIDGTDIVIDSEFYSVGDTFIKETFNDDEGGTFDTISYYPAIELDN